MEIDDGALSFENFVEKDIKGFLVSQDEYQWFGETLEQAYNYLLQDVNHLA